MKIKTLYVISGLTGMTGNELARQIRKQNDEIIGFDNFFASSLETIADVADYEKLEFYRYDLNRQNQMAEIENLVNQKKTAFDQIIYINCAAVVHTEHFYHINHTFETNVLGMKAFLDQAIRVGAKIFINCSTSEVYSMQSFREGGVREDEYLTMATAEHSQRTSYAVGKLLTEFFLKEAVNKNEIRGCSVRFANVYSKNEKYAKHIIPHILHSLEQDKKVILLDNAKITKRTFLNNIDSCAAVLALCCHPNVLDGSAFNVGTEEEISIIGLVNLCAQEMGVTNPQIEFNGYRESDPPRRFLNIEKIKCATGWCPVISLKDGIKECIQFMNSRYKDES